MANGDQIVEARATIVSDRVPPEARTALAIYVEIIMTGYAAIGVAFGLIVWLNR